MTGCHTVSYSRSEISKLQLGMDCLPKGHDCVSDEPSIARARPAIVLLSPWANRDYCIVFAVATVVTAAEHPPRSSVLQ